MAVSTRLSQLLICAISALVGGGVYILVKRLGTHLVVSDAHLWGITFAAFTYLSQFFFLRRSLRKARGVSYNTRLGFILIAVTSLCLSAFLGLSQIKRGYPPLDLNMLAKPDDQLGLHFTMTSEINPKRAYEMSGNMGEFFLVPALNFDGRVLLMLPFLPEAKKLIVTGKLRSDIRTVLTSKKGTVEGPFLQVYREDMQMAENARVLFLDTSSRAGLNFTIVIWLLISVYALIYAIRMVPNPVSRGRLKFKS